MLNAAPLLAAFLHGRRGGVAMLSAVILPAVVLVAVGAIQLQYVYSLKKQTQDVADSAALWGAQQLSLTPSGAVSRTQSWAKAQLQSLTNQSTVAITASEPTASSMTVSINVNTPSFFGNMLPAGGFNTTAQATAAAGNMSPLCVLITGSTSADNIHLSGQANMQSTCLVESDSSIVVDNGASLTSGQAEATTSASGSITPTASTGAPTVPDPFSSLNVASPLSCAAPLPAPPGPAPTALTPGAYCYPITLTAGNTLTLSGGPYFFGSGLTVNAGATLSMSSGEYYFGGPLNVTGSGIVTGNDVVLDFSKGAQVSLSGQASFNLSGRQSGALAGFVLIANRAYTGSFNIDSDYISKLTGTVYAPTAVLNVQGTTKSAQASDWTVIDALGMMMSGSPQLVINSNYSGSSVPVPNGVGSTTTSATRLTQ